MPGTDTTGGSTTVDDTAGKKTARDGTSDAGTTGAGTTGAGTTGAGTTGGDAGDDAGEPRGGTDSPHDDVAGGEGRTAKRRALAWAVTALAGLLVLFALLVPNQLSRLSPLAFVRIPIEGLFGVTLLLVLRPRPRQVVAVVAGVGLGLLAILKFIDMGFYATLSRPFDLVLDWVLFDDAVGFLTGSVGGIGAIGAVIAVVLLVIALLTLITLSVLRVTRLVVQHDTAATRVIAVLAVAWVGFAALGVRVAPAVPVAAKNTITIVHNRAHLVAAGLQDKEEFAAAAATDAFRDTRGDQLLTALRGKDVIFAFIESYGRDAVQDPEFAPQVDAVLDAGGRRLDAAGFASRSAFLTSPTSGGGSWLAHATLLSGLWINNQQRYRTLLSGDRLTLNGAFRRAGWQTVGVMPGVTRDWPEAEFYGYDRLYHSRNLGYRGPSFSWSPMPDQYTLSAFRRLEHGKPDHPPVMAEIALVSSHAPWAPIPRLIDWDDVGDGSNFREIARQGIQKSAIWSDPTRIRTEYRRSIEYTLNSLISYAETYGDDDMVLVFLGDHQPAPIVTGEGASRDVPIAVVARDQGVLDRISGWGWENGLKPGPQAPVWRMDTFRDQFLTTFGPRAEPTQPPAPSSSPAARPGPSSTSTARPGPSSTPAAPPGPSSTPPPLAPPSPPAR